MIQIKKKEFTSPKLDKPSAEMSYSLPKLSKDVHSFTIIFFILTSINFSFHHIFDALYVHLYSSSDYSVEKNKSKINKSIFFLFLRKDTLFYHLFTIICFYPSSPLYFRTFLFVFFLSNNNQKTNATVRSTEKRILLKE